MSKPLYREDVQIVLGSKSPRRRELINQLGYPFRVVTIQCEETIPSHLSKREAPVFLAKKKAAEYNEFTTNEVLITADTVVLHNDQILGKPQSTADAKEFLQSLSNGEHEVITGVCLKRKRPHFEDGTKFIHQTFHSVTKVAFRKLSEQEIDFYINHYEVFDKAGAYAIQEWIGQIGIESIHGDYYNVMGLPMQKLFSELKKIQL